MKNLPLPLMSAWFVVTGMKFDPHDCTRHFGIEPTEVLIKGQPRPSPHPLVPHSEWGVKIKRQSLSSTDTALRLLLERVWPKRKQIVDFVKKNKLEITFVLTLTGAENQNFIYEFSPATIEQLAYFKAPLHLDVY